MDQQTQARRTRAFLPTWRRMAVGVVVAALIVVASMVVVKAWPGSGAATKSAQASGGGGCGTTNCVFLFKGHTADASMVEFGSDGCTQTTWNLTASESVSRSNPGGTTSGT